MLVTSSVCNFFAHAVTTRVVSRSSQTRLCANDRITYECSVFQYTLYDNALWNVTYPGKGTIELLFQEGSAAIIERADLGIRAERVTVDAMADNFTANLQFTILPNVTLDFFEVSCGYDGLGPRYAHPVNVENISYNSKWRHVCVET